MFSISRRTLIAGSIAAAVLAGSATTATILLTSSSTRPAASSPAPSASASEQYADPVTIVRQAGATPDLSEVTGPVPGGDWWSAAGSFSPPRDGITEQVDVRTFPAGTTRQESLVQLGYDPAHNTPGSTSQVVITGGSFVVIATPGEDSSGSDIWTVSPVTIAQRVHGTVQS